MKDLKQEQLNELNEFRLTGEIFGELRVIDKGLNTFGTLFLKEANRQDKDAQSTGKPAYHNFLASDPILIKKMMAELKKGDVVSVKAYVYNKIKNINGKRFYIPSFRLTGYEIVSQTNSYEDSVDLKLAS